MGKKAEKGTPKQLANAMKSKGLQKLRFFCQLCQKQCRDENGFKCHTMSEPHQRQMLLCATNPGHMNQITSELGWTKYLKSLMFKKRAYLVCFKISNAVISKKKVFKTQSKILYRIVWDALHSFLSHFPNLQKLR